MSFSRLRSLDALRGVLAVVVVADHAAMGLGSQRLELLASVAVWMFWAMSFYVLALAWDGRYAAFLLRRAVRLWPLVALILAAAALWRGVPVSAGLLLSLPGAGYAAASDLDPPIWSLCAELWVTPALPVLFAAVAPWLRAHPLPLSERVPAPLLWLGRVSFPLYLCHGPLLLAFGVWRGVALALPVAWALHVLVERPSIAASRAVGRLRRAQWRVA